MMQALEERSLRIELPDGAGGRKFDDAAHGLSHCMKAVDFIIERNNQIYFVELKDPSEAPAANAGQYVSSFLSGNIDEDLKIKFRDSWLYEWAEGRINQPVYYLVLIGASGISKADLLVRTEALKRKIPQLGPQNRDWKNPFLAGCLVMNMESWNEFFTDMPVMRISR